MEKAVKAIRCSIFVALFLAPVRGKAEADPLGEDVRQRILGELSTIEEVVTGKRVSTRKTAVAMFQNAAASDKATYEFFLECVKMLRFDEKGGSYSDFREWRERNEGSAKDESHLLAMRLQLQYLVLTLRAAEGVDRASIVPELEEFVGRIVANAELLEGAGWKTLREPVNRTVFAEAYELNQSLQMEQWHYAPGDYAGVYEQTVLPYFRAENPAELPAAWDRRIQLESQLVELAAEEDESAIETFRDERLPRLHWQKGVDLFQHVSQQQGATALLQILRTNADHPDATKWIGEVKGLLGGGEEG